MPDVKDLYEQAQNFINDQKFPEAIEAFTEILVSDPEALDAIMGLGNCYMQMADVKLAFEQFSKGRELSPTAVDFAYQYANCLSLGGYQKEALKELQRATGLCGNDQFFALEIARLLVGLGEAQGALSMLDRLTQLNADAQVVMARALGLQNKHSESIALLHRLRQELPKEAALAGELSMAAAKTRDYRLAVSNFEDYLKLITPSAKDYLRFTDLLLYAQDLPRAEQALEQAKGDGSDTAVWFFLQARIQRLKGAYKAAFDSCQTALKLDPGNAYAWAMLIELADDDLSELAEHLEKLISSDSFVQSHQRAQALLALANCRDRQERVPEAIDSLQSANKVVAESLSSRGQSYQPLEYEEFVQRNIALFNREFFDLPGAKHKATSGRPIFVLGLPRSGTTLVERILTQNKSVTAGGEQEAMSILVNEYWHHHRNGDMPAVSELQQEHWNNLAGGCLGRYACNVNGIYTDKMPHNFQHLGFILKMFPHAKVIQMHRQTRDVALSIYQRAFADGHPYACDIQSTLHFCEHSEKLMSHWSSLNSEQILDVSYESLVTRPDFYGKQIMEFCELPWKDEYLDFDQSIAASFTFSELQVRQPINQSAIGKWERYKELFS